jgi:hypothetical protein
MNRLETIPGAASMEKILFTPPPLIASRLNAETCLVYLADHDKRRAPGFPLKQFLTAEVIAKPLETANLV